MVLLAYNLQIQKTSCLKSRSSAMVPIKQLHVKLLLYAEGKKKTTKKHLSKDYASPPRSSVLQIHFNN